MCFLNLKRSDPPQMPHGGPTNQHELTTMAEWVWGAQLPSYASTKHKYAYAHVILCSALTDLYDIYGEF